tara:strand:- start:855 stop:2504 length:1650 start_codon:yes stop_codon:yes gene_type:complete
MKYIESEFINYMKNKTRFIIFFFEQKKILLPLLILIFYLLSYFFIDFSSQSLVAHDEGLYARRSRLIEESANWFSPPFDEPHHKTLGSYWFIALSIRLFGNSELSLRLPSIIASFICLFITYRIALIISNKKSALISIFSLCSMPLWIQYSRYSSPDILFVLCILLVILFFIKFLNTPLFINKNFYIFSSGLFISVAFFIRSYMVFIPVIGLTPFLLFHLLKAKKIFKFFFFSGILIGSIPSFLNLYFSYHIFGIKGISSLFDFAKKQAIASSDINNFLLIPFNSLYFTFPVGFLLIILFIFTKSNIKIRYPLLLYCFPLLSIISLLSMSTTYSHYYLFILPFLSILFSVNLQNNLSRFFISDKMIKYSLSFTFVSLTCILVFFVLNINKYLLNYSYRNTLLVLIVSFILILSYISSIRFLFDNRIKSLNLIKLFYNIVIPQYLSLSLLYNFGVIGNPNFTTKSFLNDKYVNSIIKSNTIYLYNLESKIQTLLSYYLPSSKVITSIDDIGIYSYIITSDEYFLNSFNRSSDFKTVRTFDKHFLLVNISK